MELSEDEKQFLRFMINTAQDVMFSEGGFTEEDWAALEKFKAMGETK
jgi:hypothetical protein